MNFSTNRFSAGVLSLAAIVLPAACRGPDKEAARQNVTALLRGLETPISEFLSGIKEYSGKADSMTDQQRQSAFSTILIRWNEIEKYLDINSSAIGINKLTQAHIDLSLISETGVALTR